MKPMTEERLAEIRGFRKNWPADTSTDWEPIAMELLAEVDRLRAALKRVADGDWSYATWDGNCTCPRAAEHLLAGRDPTKDPYC